MMPRIRSRTDYNPGTMDGSTSEAICIASIAAAFVIVALRIYTRAIVGRCFGADDWVIVVSFMTSAVLVSLIAEELTLGQGDYQHAITPKDLVKYYKVFWISIMFYAAALTLTKISILLQYWRVFVSQNIRRIVIGLIIFVIAHGTSGILVTIFLCTPVEAAWDPTRPGGHCLDKTAVWFSNAAINIVTDIVICVLPMPVFKELRLPRRQRFALMAVFGLGGFVCLTSILRLSALRAISESKDPIHDNGGAAAWSALEVNVGIICACLPTLRKTVSSFFPRIFGASPNNTNASQERSHRVLRCPPCLKFCNNSSAATNIRNSTAVSRGIKSEDEARWLETLCNRTGRGAPCTSIVTVEIDGSAVTSPSTGADAREMQSLQHSSSASISASTSADDFHTSPAGTIRVDTVTKQEVEIQGPMPALLPPRVVCCSRPPMRAGRSLGEKDGALDYARMLV